MAIAGTVGREGARLLVDRVWASGGSRRIPRRIAEVDPEWLSEVLDAIWPGIEVAQIEALDGHTGTTSRSRIRLHYRRRGEGGNAPDVMFAKFAPGDLGTALFVGLMGIAAHEVRFYRELAGECPVSVPRHYCARATSHGERFLLLFEDLAAGFQGIHEPCSLERARGVVDAMSRYHAGYWQSPRFDRDLAWLPRRGADPAYRIARVICELAHKPALARSGDLVPASLREPIEAVYHKREALEDCWARGPLTLLHGDPHIGNLYFGASGDVGFLDWQLIRCGQGLRDVTHFIVSSLAVDDRRAHERDLVAHYVEGLERAGASGLTLDAALAQYRLHTLYEWYAATVTIVAALQRPEIGRVAMQRAVAAIEDWQALDALAQL